MSTHNISENPIYEFYNFIKLDVKEIVSNEVYSHAISIEKNILEMKVSDNDNIIDILLIGLLHDLTLEFDNDFHRRICEQRGVDFNHFICQSYIQVYSYTSAEFIKERYNVSEDVYNAVLSIHSNYVNTRHPYCKHIDTTHKNIYS